MDEKEQSGNYTTTSDELSNVLSKMIDADLHGICGISYEDVVLVPHKTNVGIINTDVSDGPGIHWVSFIHTDGYTIYYDSLGEPPTPEIAEKIAPGNTRLFWWDGQQQPDSSDKCGFYALKFIQNYINKRNSIKNLFDYYEMGLSYDSDYEKNEAVVLA
jgi:hypothetical protein